MGGSNFSSSSGAIPLPQPQRKLNDSPHQPNESQNKPQGLGPHVHQAYLQFALQAAQQQKSHGNLLAQQQQQHQQAKSNTISPAGRNQDVLANAMKMQELMTLQAASQAQLSKLREQGQPSGPTTNVARPMQSLYPQASSSNVANSNNQMAMAQWQAVQLWAKEQNIDLSVPANMNLVAQVLPLWQSARMAAVQKQNEANISAQQSKQPVMSSPVGSENSAQSGPLKPRQPFPSNPMATGGDTLAVNPNTIQMQQQIGGRSREGQNERVVRHPMTIGTGGQVNNQAPPEQTGSETLQMQYNRAPQPPNRPTGPSISSQATPAQMPRQNVGFTKEQLHVLKAQILAFRRLKV